MRPLSRRDFLRLAGAVGVGTILPSWLPAPEEPQAGSGPRYDRTLVLIELNGGNDGLNTVVPYADELYYRARPQLAIGRDTVLPLDEKLGLNPVLEPLMSAWREKDLAIALGVGYERPNRSHFRSIDIWNTGSESDEVADQGWVARAYAGSTAPTDLIAHGIVLGRNDMGPLAGTGCRSLLMNAPAQFLRQARKVGDVADSSPNPALQHILAVQDHIHDAASELERRLKTAPPLKTTFPKSAIGTQLETVARLVALGLTVPVFKLSHSGFDNHSNQRGNHDRLLGELAQALSAFRAALKAASRWDRVLVMTYAEFGRRVNQNASAGTDHGTAAPHFLLGGTVKGGFYGEQPQLDNLAGGDLVHTLDFHDLQYTAARRWLNVLYGGGTADVRRDLGFLG
jgi:uncharacterized protein (DUF1501 family)